LMKMAGAPLGKGPTHVCASRNVLPGVLAIISTSISPIQTVGPRASGASILCAKTDFPYSITPCFKPEADVFIYGSRVLLNGDLTRPI